MRIQELLESGRNVTIAVSPADLKEFALTVAEELRASFAPAPEEDVRLSRHEAARLLGVSTGTLWRWSKEGYLNPSGYVGQKPYYLRSQLREMK